MFDHGEGTFVLSCDWNSVSIPKCYEALPCVHVSMNEAKTALSKGCHASLPSLIRMFLLPSSTQSPSVPAKPLVPNTRATKESEGRGLICIVATTSSLFGNDHIRNFLPWRSSLPFSLTHKPDLRPYLGVLASCESWHLGLEPTNDISLSFVLNLY